MHADFFKRAAFAASLIAAPALSGCQAVPGGGSASDFGAAVKQDVAAQIADPDARYKGNPAPGSNGSRVGLAQKRYEEGKVIQPATLSASSGTISNEGANGGSGSSPGGTSTNSSSP